MQPFILSAWQKCADRWIKRNGIYYSTELSTGFDLMNARSALNADENTDYAVITRLQRFRAHIYLHPAEV